MTKRFYIGTACIIFIALVALLVYSLDRTSWLLAQYEISQPDTLAHWLGLSPLALGTSSALVIEVGLIALVAGEVLASAHPEIKRYALAGLLIGLAVQAVANLIAGYLRGYQAVYDDLVTHQVSDNLSWYVAGLSWLLSSLAVPGLIFILSRLAALTIRLAVERPLEATGTQKDAPKPYVSEPLTEQVENEDQLFAPAPTPGFVYIFSSPHGYKIGCSKNIERRRQQVAASVPFALEIVHSITSENMYATEQRLHTYYTLAGKHINGEWYTLTSVDLSTLKTIADSDIDYALDHALHLLAKAGLKDREMDGAFWLQQATAKKSPALDQSADEVAPPFTLADLLMTPLETEQFFDEVLEPKRKMTMADLEALTDVVLPGESQAVINGHRYECPHCGAPVKSKQARGAAVKNGYCLTCKKVQA